MILEPGIFEKSVVVDLAEVKIIKISTLIVIAEDGTTAPFCMAAAIFILQTIPERYVFQAAGRHHLRSKFDGTGAITGAAPDDERGTF